VGKAQINNVVLCNVIVCAGQRSHAVVPCCRLAIYQGLLGSIQWPSLRYEIIIALEFRESCWAGHTWDLLLCTILSDLWAPR